LSPRDGGSLVLRDVAAARVLCAFATMRFGYLLGDAKVNKAWGKDATRARASGHVYPVRARTSAGRLATRAVAVSRRKKKGTAEGGVAGLSGPKGMSSAHAAASRNPGSVSRCRDWKDSNGVLLTGNTPIHGALLLDRWMAVAKALAIYVTVGVKVSRLSRGRALASHDVRSSVLDDAEVLRRQLAKDHAFAAVGTNGCGTKGMNEVVTANRGKLIHTVDPFRFALQQTTG
jgi:hypothetical protein